MRNGWAEVRVRQAHDGQQQLADVDGAGGPRLGVEAARLATHPRVVLMIAPLRVELLGQPLGDLGRHLPGAVQGRRVGRRGLRAHNARGAAAQVDATVARRQLKGRHQRCDQREEKRSWHNVPPFPGLIFGTGRYAADVVLPPAIDRYLSIYLSPARPRRCIALRFTNAPWARAVGARPHPARLVLRHGAQAAFRLPFGLPPSHHEPTRHELACLCHGPAKAEAGRKTPVVPTDSI